MQTIEIKNPFSGQIIDVLTLETRDQILQKLQIATDFFANQTLEKTQRIEVLEKLVILMRQNFDLLVQTALSEGGKPLVDTKVEINRAIQGVSLAKEALFQLKGKEIPMALNAASKNKQAYTTYKPIGVVLAISAFNHPVNLLVHQVVTAIAAGCPVLVKPALQTPLSAQLLLDLLYQAGLPKQAAQMVLCHDDEAENLASQPQIAFLSFIGSAKVGWHLRKVIAEGTRIALEHGGVAPVLITKDYPWEKCIDRLIKGAFYHAGQVCVSVQKIFVHQTQFEDFAKDFAKKAAALRVGDPSLESTEVGPLIRPADLARIASWVHEALEAGATLHCGGNVLENQCFEPTVLSNLAPELKVSTQEVFGPIACLYVYQDVQEVYEQINKLPFAFQASIFTEKILEAFDATEKMQAATILVNEHTAFRVDWMPFGGVKASGLGKGGILESIQEMSFEQLHIWSTQ